MQKKKHCESWLILSESGGFELTACSDRSGASFPECLGAFEPVLMMLSMESVSSSDGSRFVFLITHRYATPCNTVSHLHTYTYPWSLKDLFVGALCVMHWRICSNLYKRTSSDLYNISLVSMINHASTILQCPRSTSFTGRSVVVLVL